MEIDQRKFDDAAEAREGSLAEGLTGTIGSVLNNPVLPSQFELLAPTSTRARKWQFAHRSLAPFGKAGKGFRSSLAIGVR